MSQYLRFEITLITLMTFFIMILQGWAQQPSNQFRGAERKQRHQEIFSRILRHDKNKDGKVTRDEWSGPRQIFARFDKDGNKVLTREEVNSYQGSRPLPASEPKGSSSVILSDVIGNESMSIRIARYQAFATTKPLPGDIAPGFELDDPEGNRISLVELLKTKPVVIETGSYTCPVFRGKHRKIASLQDEFADKVHFLVLYGREAHARSGKYKDIHPPKNLDQRITLAKKVAEEIKISMPIAIDNIDNKVSLAYGGLPNCGYIIGQDGHVFFKMPWIHEGLLREPLEVLLNQGGKGGEKPQRFATGNTLPSGRSSSKKGGPRRRGKMTRGSENKKTPLTGENAPLVIPKGYESKIVWTTDFNAARKLAHKSGMLLFVKFYFNGCPVCEAMDKGPLKSLDIVALSRKYVGVKVDITTDDGEKIAKQYDVIGTPVFVILSADGAETIVHHSGPADIETMKKFLEGGLTANRPVVQKDQTQ